MNLGPDSLAVDATLGEGGHAREILSRLSAAGKLIGIERDSRMIAALAISDPRLFVVEGNFRETVRYLKSLGHDQARAVLADLGLSMRHYRTPEWGFSFSDGPLDMRLGTRGPTAADVLNTWDERQLADLFLGAGLHRGRAIAKSIVDRREKNPFSRTSDLMELGGKAKSSQGGRRKSNPATSVFRAIREAVTGELKDLAAFLRDVPDAIETGGRLAVLAYTWEEERIVRSETDILVKGCICPPRLPVCRCGRKPSMKWISRKGIKPTEEEIRKNPSARSAKLFVMEKI